MTSDQPRVLVVGDPYFTAADFRDEFTPLEPRVAVSYFQIETTAVPATRTESETRLREYAGDPADVTRETQGHQVLVVHGAPVSEETLSVPGLELVCCVRGGPVNVDIAAATQRGIPVCNAPGKNAAAVAELTIAFALMQIRGIPISSRELAGGKPQGESVFDGREYFGTEAPSTTLGLVGYGLVGKEVARRARDLGFTVLVHDPFVTQADEGVELVELDELLRRSHLVSLHARLTPQTRNMM
ncbi:MAG: hydroxyacid dehydrogenase, partial [Actinomycetia bacterium]|nr:hydroxyacid dehydrogenase [Actinomycetes bacterium]